MMACAQTGSGKTAAFLLPMIHDLLENPVDDHPGRPQLPEVLIITPTRELAVQIDKEARKFAHGTKLGSMCVVGGHHEGSMLEKLREKSINIIAATPGRLKQCILKEAICLKNLRFLVLDEADRMLDMGFQGDIDEVVQNPLMPPKSKRQTLMFSATFPDAIQKAAATYLADDYLFVQVCVFEYVFKCSTYVK